MSKEDKVLVSKNLTRATIEIIVVSVKIFPFLYKKKSKKENSVYFEMQKINAM